MIIVHTIPFHPSDISTWTHFQGKGRPSSIIDERSSATNGFMFSSLFDTVAKRVPDFPTICWTSFIPQNIYFMKSGTRLAIMINFRSKERGQFLLQVVYALLEILWLDQCFPMIPQDFIFKSGEELENSHKPIFCQLFLSV